MIYPGEGEKGQPRAGDYVLAAERVRAEAAASPHQTRAFDLVRADKWEGQARTNCLRLLRIAKLRARHGLRRQRYCHSTDRCSRGVDSRWAPTPRCGMSGKIKGLDDQPNGLREQTPPRSAAR